MSRYLAHAGHEHEEETDQTTSIPDETNQPTQQQSAMSESNVITSESHNEFSVLPIVGVASVAVVLGLAVSLVALQRVGKKRKK